MLTYTKKQSSFLLCGCELEQLIRIENNCEGCMVFIVVGSLLSFIYWTSLYHM